MEYISLIISALGAVGVLVTLITLISKKGKEQGQLETKLDYIIKSDEEQKGDIKSIIKSQSELNEKVVKLTTNVALVEKTAHKAHERIDEVKKQVNKMSSEIATFVEIKKRRNGKNGTTD